MLKFDRIWRVWTEIEGESRSPIPAYAIPQSIKLSDNLLSFRLPLLPETSALLKGFRYANGGAISREFSCLVSGGRGQLRAIGSGFSIDENDIKTCDMLAYHVPENGRTAQEIAIVTPGQVQGNGRISIAPGAAVTATPDLEGKNIKVRVTYPKTIVLTQDPIESVYLHVVGRWEDDSDRYCGIPGCLIEDTRARTVRFRLGVCDRMEVLK